MNVARALCEFLMSHGCNTLFGVPGYANTLLLLETDNVPGLSPILTKHEGSASWMAYGYAQSSGRFGACTGTSGPGTTNLLTGVAGAYMNSVPMLVLTGQVEKRKFGRGAFQELTGRGPRSVDVMRVFDTMTKWNVQLQSPDELEDVLRNALRALTTGRLGPVHINIPVDVLRAEIAPLHWSLGARPTRDVQNSQHQDGPETAARAAIEALQTATAPLLLLGKGCHSARKLFRDLAKISGIPVATTLQGKGIVCSSDGLFFGIVGTGGSIRASRYILEACDLVIAVGTSLGEFTLDGYNPNGLQNKEIIRVDIDPLEFEKAPFVRRNFQGDAGAFAMALLTHLSSKDSSQKRAGATSSVGTSDLPLLASTHWNSVAEMFEREFPLSTPVPRDKEIPGAVAPMDIVEVVADWADNDALFVADSGNAAIWACHYLQLKQHQEFHIDINLASMGSGILSSLGHAIASKHRQVICFVGDGTFFMNGIDISTAADYGIHVVWVVFNDGKLGMVEQGNKAIYGWSRAVTYVNHDIASLALACGARASKVRSKQELAEALTASRSGCGPLVLDVCLNDAYLPQVYSRTQKPRQTDPSTAPSPETSQAFR